MDAYGTMSQQTTSDARTAWKQELPALVGPSVTLREPTAADLESVIEILLTSESVRFGIAADIADTVVAAFIEQARADRAAGRAYTYLATVSASGRTVGLFQVRALDPVFENAEWEASLLPSVRGTGLFMECAQLVATFAFRTLGSHRLESRVLFENGRANGALRKLGAVQEGVLRRSLRRDGRYYDQVLWSLLAGDWTGRRLPAGEWVH